ncbi:MAG: amidase [Myxococcales bacterium]|nr:amidase [Myxococcales bacterium]
MKFDEYVKYDAMGLAALVRKREVRPAELVELARARIAEVNPKINAVVQDRCATARTDGSDVGPFKGVPFLLKDLLATEAGIATSHGCRFFREFVSDHDSELVARQRRAGLVFIGKTAASELGILPVTETAAWGITRNPWNPERTPGGSSGGAAAAVAAGIVPMAHASDGGGSIRIPASCCGLFGLKPSRGRNPFGPDYGEGWHGIAVEHCVSRSVRDSAALLDATAGPDLGAPYAAPPPERPFLEEVGRDPGRLKIAFTTRSLLGSAVDRDCVEAVERAAKLCESLGHRVEEGAPAIDRAAAIHAYLVLASAETAAAIDGGARLLRRKLDASQFEPGTWFLAQVGRAHTAAELSYAVHVIHLAGRAVARWFTSYDLLLTPTLAQPPLKIGALQPKRHELAALALLRKVPSRRALRAALALLAQRAFEFAAFTPIANLTGQPAMSVPLHFARGLPIGVHFMARQNDEGLLFRLAAQLEPSFTRPFV